MQVEGQIQRWKRFTKNRWQNFEFEKLAHKILQIMLKIVQKLPKNAKNCTQKFKGHLGTKRGKNVEKKTHQKTQKIAELWKICTRGAFFHLWGNTWTIYVQFVVPLSHLWEFWPNLVCASSTTVWACNILVSINQSNFPWSTHSDLWNHRWLEWLELL